MANTRAITQARTLCTIWIGIVAGIFNLEGLAGVGFYILMDFLVGILICLRFGFKPEPYFNSVFAMMGTGFCGNVMTYLVVWVLFHNLVYIL